MRKTVLLFSTLIIAIAALFQISKYAIFYNDLRIELILGLVAVLFFIFGTFLQKKSQQYKSDISTVIDYKLIKSLQISNREYEVLEALCKHMSNKEIADSLFLSESTVKTHVSNIFQKLEVGKRAEAIRKAMELKLIDNQGVKKEY